MNESESQKPKNKLTDQHKQAVYQVMQHIPEGKACSYGVLARLAGLSGRARWVGTLLSNLPKGTSLPWHRVVRASGELAFPVDTAKFREQKQRLMAEGVDFTGKRVLKSHLLKAD